MDLPADDRAWVGDQPLGPQLAPKSAVEVRGEECEVLLGAPFCVWRLSGQLSPNIAKSGASAFSRLRYAGSVGECDGLTGSLDLRGLNEPEEFLDDQLLQLLLSHVHSRLVPTQHSAKEARSATCRLDCLQENELAEPF